MKNNHHQTLVNDTKPTSKVLNTARSIAINCERELRKLADGPAMHVGENDAGMGFEAAYAVVWQDRQLTKLRVTVTPYEPRSKTRHRHLSRWFTMTINAVENVIHVDKRLH